MTDDTAYWTPVIHRSGKPVYLEIADAIAHDIGAERLRPGDRLPPQRWLADQLGVNFSTISRAYSEAHRRGLIDARVGFGTFVLPPPGATVARPPERPQRPADMTMNLPPEPDDPTLLARMVSGFDHLKTNYDIRELLRYQSFGGAYEDRAAGVQWLSGRLPKLDDPQRLLVCPGAQSALMAILTALAGPGDRICCESLTFPGLRALAGHLGIALTGLEMDPDGIDPDAFELSCRQAKPKALYINPTLHNPTTLTVPETRRHALIAVARRHGVPIIEDDAYGALPEAPPPPFAVLAPDMTFHIAGLSKCMGAGLRIAYLVPPGGQPMSKVAAALRATAGMASPITAALATRWITDGTALALLSFIRTQASLRQAIVASILDAGTYVTQPEAFHIWLTLPPPWTRSEVLHHLRALGVGVVTADAFAAKPNPPEAVRLCIGGALDLGQLRDAITVLADTLSQSPGMISAII